MSYYFEVVYVRKDGVVDAGESALKFANLAEAMGHFAWLYGDREILKLTFATSRGDLGTPKEEVVKLAERRGLPVDEFFTRE